MKDMAVADVMRIYVKMLTQHIGCHHFDLRDADGVSGLRANIFRARDHMPLERQLLTYEGQLLEDGRLLSYYGIGEGSVVQLSDSVCIRVTLQQFGGDNLSRIVDVSPFMDLSELRTLAGELVDIWGAGVMSLALAVGDVRCRDMGETLHDCNIVDGTVVTIVETAGITE